MIVDIITDHNNTINSNSNGRQYKKDNKTHQPSVKPLNIGSVHNLGFGLSEQQLAGLNKLMGPQPSNLYPGKGTLTIPS